jgi:transcriptional regulator with XRE-family HTH domain
MSNYHKANGLNSLRQAIAEKEKYEYASGHEMQEENEESDDKESRVGQGRTWNDPQLAMIGQHVRNVRLLRKMPQSELERRLKINQGYISYIEGGKLKRIDRTLVKSIAFHLESDFTDLLLEVDKKNVAFAEPATHKDRFQRTRIHREEFTGDDFIVEYEVNNENFELKIIGNDGVSVQAYKGKKIRQHAFLEAVEEAVRMIRKAL